MTTRPMLLATIDGYAVEGGFDGPGQPATCFGPMAYLKRDLSASNVGLWQDFENVIDVVPSLGLDGVCLTLEWARLEPCAGVVDDAAYQRYARAAQHAKSLGLHVTGVLVDAAWPAWLGSEAWILPWTAPWFESHVVRTLERLADVLDDAILFSNAAKMVRDGYVTRRAPPWRRGARDDAASARAQLDNIVARLPSSRLSRPLVARYREVSLDHSVGKIRRAISRASPDEHVHLRSLVGGRVLSTTSEGLLIKQNGHWGIASPDLRRLFT